MAARIAAILGRVGLALALGLSAAPPSSAEAGQQTQQQDKAKKPAAKKGKAKRATGDPKAGTADDAMPRPGPASASADGEIKFSRDIAPLLVANCQGCHNEKDKARRGNFDQSSFESLMKGGKGGEVIVPGNPEASPLVLRIMGEGDGAKMPPGQRTLAPETATKIAQWVAAGAKLDAGVDPKTKMTAYAASVEDLKKAGLAKLTPEQRDKRSEQLALERFKKAKPDAKPEMVADAKAPHVLAFGNMPKDRAVALIKSVEKQYVALSGLLGRDGKAGLDWPEKVGLYVLKDNASYVEFVRAVENREVEPGTEAHFKFDVDGPYIAAIDPQHYAEESPGAARKAGRSKKGDDGGPDRTLAGLATEQLAAGAAAKEGKPPRWLSLGLGAMMAARVESPRSPYYRKLRDLAYEQARLGWESKANDALGDEGDPEKVKAIGYAVVECVAATSGDALGPFVRGMLAGREKLDDVLAQCFGGNRAQFLEDTGQWVGSNYGRK